MPRDPLRALGDLRKRTVDECASNLADAVQKADRARLGRQAEEQARTLERERNQAIQALERSRLDQGQARARDLACQADFARGAAGREQLLDQRLQVAQRRESIALGERSKAEKDLEEAEAARVALERFKGRREAREHKVSERRQDDDAMDRFNRVGRKVQV